MAFSSGSGKGPMADINVTPLVDVMLVLLIIFMITAPMLTHKVKIDLPQLNNDVPPPTNPQEPVKLRIDQSGAMYWNDTPVDEGGLKAQFAVIGGFEVSKQQEVQIQADDAVAYENVARVLAAAKSYGLTKIGFSEVQ
jgi:biopolymer transport protein ExbD